MTTLPFPQSTNIRTLLTPIVTLHCRRFQLDDTTPDEDKYSLEDNHYNRTLDRIFDRLPAYHAPVLFRGGWREADGTIADYSECKIPLILKPAFTASFPHTTVHLYCQGQDLAQYEFIVTQRDVPHDLTSKLTKTQRLALTWFLYCVIDTALND